MIMMNDIEPCKCNVWIFVEGEYIPPSIPLPMIPAMMYQSNTVYLRWYSEDSLAVVETSEGE